MEETLLKALNEITPHLYRLRIELVGLFSSILIIGYTKRLLNKRKYQKNQEKLSELPISKALKESPPEYKIYKNKIRLYNLSAKITDDIVTKNLEPISNIFNKKLTSHQKGYSGFFTKELYYDVYENQLKKVVAPIYTGSSTTIIGLDQYNHKIELKRKTDYLIAIFAASGSGKSVVVSGITSSFIKRDINKRKRIIFLDYKGLDSTTLIKRLNASSIKTEIVFFDMSTSEGLKKANQYIKTELIEKFNESKRIIAENSEVVLYTDYERERESNNSLPKIPFLTNTLMVCDEMLQYINPFSADNDEDKKNKMELAESIKIIGNVFRISGANFIFTSQEVAKDQLKNFRMTNMTTKIFGNLNNAELESKYQIRELNKTIGLNEGKLVIQSDKYKNTLFKASFTEDFYDFLKDYQIVYTIQGKAEPTKESLRATHLIYKIDSNGNKHEVLASKTITTLELKNKILATIRASILKDE